MRTALGIFVAMCLFLVGALPAQAAPLTEDALKTMLQNLGYTVDESAGKQVRHFKIKESLPDNSVTFTITVELSPDKNWLWIYAGLYGVPEGKTAPNKVLLGLLEKSDDLGPQFFSYNTTNNLFYLNAPAGNTDVTPAVLRERLKTFITNLSTTRDLWDPDKWGQ